MEIGIDSFVELVPTTPAELPAQSAVRTAQLLDEIVLADTSGVDAFGIGEHHREEYIASSPVVLLAAAAARTTRIKLHSAVTVLSSDDPVRVFQDFATLDLISQGRAEIIVGRGSFTESYPLFGFDMQHYDELFAEKLDLLLELRDQTRIHWQGKHRASLTGQGVWPRPLQAKLPIRLGVGGTPNSFARAGLLGLPLTLAIIGGEPHRFRPLVDLYRESYKRAGHDLAGMSVAIHGVGFIADTDQQAADKLFPAHSATFNRIGKERGWGPTTRASFDAQTGPTGAYMVGSPATVATKMRYIDKVLGGIDRIGIVMSGGVMPHTDVMHAIKLMGTELKPLLS